MLTEKDKEFIAQLNESFVNDDNCYTANPIYEVRSKIKIYGLDEDYGDDYIWVTDGGDNILYDDDDIKSYFDDNDIIYDDNLLEDKYDLEDKLEDIDFRKTFYSEVEKKHQSFFTRSGAEEYIRINGHNLEGNPYIYVESLFRNNEMQKIKEIIIKLNA